MFTALVIFGVLVIVVASRPHDYIQGVPALTADDLNFSAPSPACSGFNWYACPLGYGISINNTKYNDCCENVAGYCPSGFTSCNPNMGCCQTGFDIYCAGTGGHAGYCCTLQYPVCGPDNTCIQGNCECENCLGPDPCQFQPCDGCAACCENYIPAICSGSTCSGGVNGQPCNVTTDLCSASNV